MIKKLNILLFAVLALCLVNTDVFAQASCNETAGTLTAPDGVPNDGTNNTMCSDGSDAALYEQTSPPADNGGLADYSYILQVPDGSGGVTLVISPDGTLDPTDPAGDGSIPALQAGDVIEVTGAAYDIAALNTLINTLDGVCPFLESGGTVPPGTCAIITDIIDGNNDGVAGLQSLDEALGIASALGAAVTDAGSALDALVTVDVTAEILGGVCYAVTGWPDPAVPGVPGDDTVDPPIPPPSTFWEGPAYTITVVDCPPPCAVEAATISTNDLTTVCVNDGADENISVTVDGGSGATGTFVITDDSGIILDIPAGTGPFSFEGVPAGTCQIWYLFFDETDTPLTDADGGAVDAGDDATMLQGCFALSNAIEIVREDCPTCDDGVQNGDETGVDCGGAICPACPTCDDGIQNQDETGVDCGGATCPACPVEETCDDGIQNQDETGVDCGGATCPACPVEETCDDGIQNQDETGVDCGGATCPACPVEETCDDGIQNQDETGVDCGGASCPACPTGCDADPGTLTFPGSGN